MSHRKHSTPHLATFGQRLKAARLVAGLSQKKLAPMAGCSRTLIVTLEQGKTKEVSSSLIFALADAVEVSPRWLAIGEGTQAGTKGLSDQEKHMILIYRLLPKELKDHLGRVIQSLADAAATSSPTRASPIASPPPQPLNKLHK